MGLRKAINDKCKDCIYDSCAPGTWRQQVDACQSEDCSLWEHRPRSKSARGADEQEIVALEHTDT